MPGRRSVFGIAAGVKKLVNKVRRRRGVYSKENSWHYHHMRHFQISRHFELMNSIRTRITGPDSQRNALHRT